MRAASLVLLLPLVACDCESEETAPEAEAEAGAELILPGEGEAAAQEAAARRAVEAINDENADDTFEDLEALIEGEENQ